MENFRSKRGLTLLEVIISIAILGIIATAFLNLFGNSFVSIASFGGKSEAVLGASDILEQVYSWQNQEEEKPEEEKIKTKDEYELKLEEFLSETMGGDKKENKDKLNETLGSEKSFNYYLEYKELNIGTDNPIQKIKGHNLTIAVPNGNKGNMEELSSFIPIIDLVGGA